MVRISSRYGYYRPVLASLKVISCTILMAVGSRKYAKKRSLNNHSLNQELRNYSLSNIEKLRAIMAALRHPENGCPWDQEQNFTSIVPHTLEEAYEVAEAIENGDMAELRDELGDLLFQVVFYARLAEEQGDFDFDQVVKAIVDKLVRRHPHVFGDAQIADAEAQSKAWEAQKAQERAVKPDAPGVQGKMASNRAGTLDGVAIALPALTRAAKLQKRAARVGFDWPDVSPVLGKVLEELNEVKAEITEGGGHAKLEEELGDLLFACTNLARHLEVEPETALRQANRKFERRFARMETMVQQQGVDITQLGLDAWEDLWCRVKDEEHTANDESH